MEKLLVVDTWTEGLDPARHATQHLSSDYDIYFAHYDSTVFKYKQSNPASQNGTGGTFSKILDYRHYDNSMRTLISCLEPDVVIFPSVHNITHKWANYICKIMGIPTLHYMHGLKGTGLTKVSELKSNINKLLNPAKSIKRILFHTEMYFQYVTDVGFQNLPDLTTILSEYIENIFMHEKYRHNPKYTYNISYDTMCVIQESDINYYKKRYDIEDTKWVVSGHVELDAVYRYIKKNDPTRKDVATYMLQPYESEKKRKMVKECLICLKKYLKEQGIALRIRPHPRQNQEMIDKVNQIGVELSDQVLAKDISESSLVLGTTSTTLYLASRVGVDVVNLLLPDMTPLSYLQEYEKLQTISYNNVVSDNININTNKSFSGFNIEKQTPCEIISEEIEALVGQ